MTAHKVMPPGRGKEKEEGKLASRQNLQSIICPKSKQTLEYLMMMITIIQMNQNSKRTDKDNGRLTVDIEQSDEVITIANCRMTPSS